MAAQHLRICKWMAPAPSTKTWCLQPVLVMDNHFKAGLHNMAGHICLATKEATNQLPQQQQQQHHQQHCLHLLQAV